MDEQGVGQAGVGVGVPRMASLATLLPFVNLAAAHPPPHRAARLLCTALAQIMLLRALLCHATWPLHILALSLRSVTLFLLVAESFFAHMLHVLLSSHADVDLLRCNTATARLLLLHCHALRCLGHFSLMLRFFERTATATFCYCTAGLLLHILQVRGEPLGGGAVRFC